LGLNGLIKKGYFVILGGVNPTPTSFVGHFSVRWSSCSNTAWYQCWL